MTIIVGFTSDEAVVVASDSQASYEGSTSKQSEFQKIFKVESPTGAKVAVGMSGDLDVGACFIEMFEQALGDVDISRERSIADAAESAMKRTQSKFLAASREQGASTQEISERLLGFKCEILFGYLYGKKPLLYSIRLVAPVSIRIAQPFEALGCGANIAHLVLSGFPLPKMSAQRALGLAAYAIQLCKDNDSGCSGRTQTGIVYFDDDSKKIVCAVGDKKWSNDLELAALEVQKKIDGFLWKEVGAAMARHGFGKDEADGPPVTPPSPQKPGNPSSG